MLWPRCHGVHSLTGEWVCPLHREVFTLYLPLYGRHKKQSNGSSPTMSPSSRPAILFTGIVSYKVSSKCLGLVYIGQLELERTTTGEGEGGSLGCHHP